MVTAKQFIESWMTSNYLQEVFRFHVVKRNGNY
jgi:hypothetical protein